MSNLYLSYSKIHDIFHELELMNNSLNQKRQPKFTDKQLIALSLAAENQDIDSECYLFKRILLEINTKIERYVYNRRRRKLSFKIEQFRQQIATQLGPEESCYFVDSMPLEICKMLALNDLGFARTMPNLHPIMAFVRRKTVITSGKNPCRLYTKVL